MDYFNAQRIARTGHEMRVRSIPPVPEDMMWERDGQRQSRRTPLRLVRVILLAIVNTISRFRVMTLLPLACYPELKIEKQGRARK
jgi:hypothetical protein